MARKMVNLWWISNNATRHATYKRRYQALAKKAGELVTLCGIKICVVVYGDGQAQPVWPSESRGIPSQSHIKAPWAGEQVGPSESWVWDLGPPVW